MNSITFIFEMNYYEALILFRPTQNIPPRKLYSRKMCFCAFNSFCFFISAKLFHFRLSFAIKWAHSTMVFFTHGSNQSHVEKMSEFGVRCCCCIFFFIFCLWLIAQMKMKSTKFTFALIHFSDEYSGNPFIESIIWPNTVAAFHLFLLLEFWWPLKFHLH